MGKNFCIGFFLCISLCSWGQEHAWVYFKDKQESAAYMSNPLTMLSQKALDRRAKQQIALDLYDVPITATYLNTVGAIDGVEVLAKSKWFNAVHVQGTRNVILSLRDLSFVERVVFAADEPATQSASQKQLTDKFAELPAFNYGNSANQIEMINLDQLHAENFTGEGMTIAVMDGGFPNVNTFAAFTNLRVQGQLKGGYDFVRRNANFYTGVSHGTSVLSIMAGYVDGQLIGTAPAADYYLFITEDGANESPLEESLWVEAAEKADSLGVDIINTSLGYSTFDDARYNYTYADMDGNTTFITRGADMAFSRGMMVVVSAGNEGNKTWRYITAPADGVDVLTIGAVDGLTQPTSFSSYGPTADGRTKPDITAKGGGTTIVNSSGAVSTGSGTSYSGPVIAGAVACLWQANPTKTNREILDIIRSSGNLFNNPTPQEGFGIPDFKQALETLSLGDATTPSLRVYPNPTQESLFVTVEGNARAEISIFDVAGRRLVHKKLGPSQTEISVAHFNAGIYLIQVNQSKFQKFIKQ